LGSGIEELIREWPGHHVLTQYEPSVPAWIFICIHSTAHGVSAGGTRLDVYQSPALGLKDGMRLAESMTYKAALAGLPHGGGKAVIAVDEMPAGRRRRALFAEYGRLLAFLRGSFVTGPDLNTSAADMDIIGEYCETVLGRSVNAGGSGGSGRDTATGVEHAICATLDLLYGSPQTAGRTIVVQGLGEVGFALAEALVEEGARVIGTDIDPTRLRLAHEQLRIDLVRADRALAAECDVLAPCAKGDVIAPRTVSALRCRAIVGAANNQLRSPAVASDLEARGILYAPDFVVNAGGGIHLFGTEVMGWSRAEIEARLAGIADTLREVFALAADSELTTVEAAVRLARSRSASRSAPRT
jgi:glutamate dehydrogenase/leucine dehydrogenase